MILDFSRSSPSLPLRQAGIHLDLTTLHSARREFYQLLKEFPVPSDQLPRDHKYFKPKVDGTELDLGMRSLEKTPVSYDPLSHSSTSKYSDSEMLQIIITDVERLFPQYPHLFTANHENKVKITQVLFTWWKVNEDKIGYCQGMHEIAGLIYLSILKESVSPNTVQCRDEIDRKLVDLLNCESIQADVFTIFSRVIACPRRFYYDENCLIQESIMFNLLFHRFDPLLFYLITQKLKIDTSVWILRYLRLLLLREIGLPQGVALWDKLIAYGFQQKKNTDPELDVTILLPNIVMLLLEKIASQLQTLDYGQAMYLLLHYPMPCNDDANSRHSLDEDSDVRPVDIDVDEMAQDAILLLSHSPEVDKAIRVKYSGLDSPAETPVVKKLGLSNYLDKYFKTDETTPDQRSAYNRTRLEMRLKKRVSSTMKK